MESFSIDEYDEDLRKNLVDVLKELREQFLINGRSSQFWFDTPQATNGRLTEPIINKCLQILANKGIIYFYRPQHDFEFERDLVFTQRSLEMGHKWSIEMINPFLIGFGPHPYPSIAIDTYGNNLNKVIQLANTDKVLGAFRKDSLDRLYYGTALLDNINNSPIKKAVLSEFLVSDSHIVTIGRLMDLLLEDKQRITHKTFTDEEKQQFLDDIANDNKRNRLISEINKELRNKAKGIEIESHKSGHSVDYYQLIIHL